MANEAQTGHWNSAEASHWVTCQLRCDTMVAPFSDRPLAATHIVSPDRVTDVGCGRGAGRRPTAAGTAQPVLRLISSDRPDPACRLIG